MGNTKIITKLTLNVPTTKVIQNNYVTISGKFTTDTNKILANTALKINLNNNIISVKTNENGTYSYKFKASKIGTNTVTVSFAGNDNYNASSIKTSFNITK